MSDAVYDFPTTEPASATRRAGKLACSTVESISHAKPPLHCLKRAALFRRGKHPTVRKEPDSIMEQSRA
jgi:hypothetical protein